ncbi:MAG TPA: translation initiation factor IF-3, partial [Candidatus Paceibacterota bacterium]|nr:translation initiation factor IF-3 [Candidatus Paceibacterota bacterium]
NNQIKEEVILLITSTGEMHGEISIEDALTMAQEENLDLVEVSKSKNGKPPVCKLVDYGKLKYKESKKKHTVKEKTKEVIFGLNIGEHDLNTKNKHVFKFLEKDCKIRYVLELRGRQRDMVQEGMEKVLDNLRLFKTIAKCSEPKIERSRGRNRIVTILQSNHK